MNTGISQLIEQAVAATPGAVRAAGRLMSLLENEPQRLPELLHAAGPRATQPRLLLGVTGAPGSGKSTLTDALVAEHRRRWPERRVGVIAVDPSSPFTGGAVLGDRVRMMRHATDAGVYVRSLASRGHLGGLSLGVKGVIRVMGLIGCDVVFLETVGVGQSEVEIARVADTVAVVLAPGQGDSVQLLKAGLLEIGDLFVVNKADRADAQELYTALLAALRMDSTPDADAAEVRLVSATQGDGIPELFEWIEKADAGKSRKARRQQSEHDTIREAILVEARRRLTSAMEEDGVSGDQVQRVLSGDVTVPQLVQALLERSAKNGADVQ